MIRLTTEKEPRNRIELYGNKLVALGCNGKSIMVRSRLLGVKIQLNKK